MMNSYRTGGLLNKYVVTKVDGTDIDPNAYYFPLRLDTDPHARLAVTVYAHSVRAENPELAMDIIKKLMQLGGLL